MQTQGRKESRGQTLLLPCLFVCFSFVCLLVCFLNYLLSYGSLWLSEEAKNRDSSQVHTERKEIADRHNLQQGKFQMDSRRKNPELGQSLN